MWTATIAWRCVIVPALAAHRVLVVLAARLAWVSAAARHTARRRLGLLPAALVRRDAKAAILVAMPEVVLTAVAKAVRIMLDRITTVKDGRATMGRHTTAIMVRANSAAIMAATTRDTTTRETTVDKTIWKHVSAGWKSRCK